MEIIAKKFNRKKSFIFILLASVLVLACGLALLIAAIINSSMDDVYMYLGIFFTAIGVFVTTLSLIALIRYSLLPDTLLTYENGVFTLPKGNKIETSKIQDVKYVTATPSYSGITYNMGFGRITIFAEGKKQNVNYVSDTANVYDRILEIVRVDKLVK